MKNTIKILKAVDTKKIPLYGIDTIKVVNGVGSVTNLTVGVGFRTGLPDGSYYKQALENGVLEIVDTQNVEMQHHTSFKKVGILDKEAKEALTRAVCALGKDGWRWPAMLGVLVSPTGICGTDAMTLFG